MGIHGKLSLACQTLQGFLFEIAGLVLAQIVEELPLEDEEAAVDVFVQDGLFFPGSNLACLVRAHSAKAAGHTHTCEGAYAAGLLVEAHESVNVDIRHTVSVGDHEAIRVDVAGNSLQAPTLEGLCARVAECHAPVFNLACVRGDVPGFQGNREIRVPSVVVGKVLFDDFALVAQWENEVVVAKAAVDVHDVPQNGSSANFDHGLGLDRGLFAQPCALATAHDYDFHEKFSAKPLACRQGRAPPP